MTLVATPGAADANTYASLAEADTYHAQLPTANKFTKAWEEADDLDKEGALVMAARFLDAMPQAWTGAAAAETQSLGWPRVGMLNRNGFAIGSTIVPIELKNAQSEFARRLLEEDRTGDNDVVNQRIKRVKAGPVEVSFSDKVDYNGELVPDAVTAVPAGTLLVPDVVKVMLVPSWLLPTVDQLKATGSQFIFTNLG